MSSDKSNLVVLAHFQDPYTANIAKGFLDSNDIISFIYDNAAHSMAWSMNNLPGGVRLMVPRSQYEEAAMLLSSFEER